MANTINVKLRLATNEFVKSMQRAEKQMRRSGERMARIGTELSTSLSVPLAAIGGAALKSFADLEKFTNGLASMMGGAEAAAAEMEKLKEIAQAPGLDLSQAVKGSVRLQSVGIAAEQARDVLAQTGNAIALVGGSSDDLDGVTLALQQIGSKGKVFAEEINQINERLPQIRAAMKAAFGTANTEDIQAMGISAEEFIAGITTELGKLPRATGGMANAFNNARQAVVQALADIGGSLEENFNVTERINNFSKSVQNLATSFTQLSPPMQKAIVITGGFFVAMGPALKVVGALRLAMAATAGQAVFLARSLQTVIGFTQIFTLSNLKGVAAIIAKNAAMIAENAILATAIVLVDAYIAAETALITIKKVLTGQVKIFTIAQKALNFVLAANPIGLVVVALGALATAFVAAYQNVDWFRNGVNQAMVFVKKLFGNVIKSIITGFKNLPAVFKATFAAMKAFVNNAALNFKKLVLSAKSFQLKFSRALTISKEKRAELTKSINAIGEERKNIKAQGQKIGEVFREAFIFEVAKMKAQKIQAPDLVFNMGGGQAPTGAAAPAQSNTVGVQTQTKAIQEQVTAVKQLQAATELQGVAMAASLQGSKKELSETEKILFQYGMSFSKITPEIDLFKGVNQDAATAVHKLRKATENYAKKVPDMAQVISDGIDNLKISTLEAAGVLVSDLMDVKIKAKEMSESLGISFNEAKAKVAKAAIGKALTGAFLMPIINVAEQLGKIAITTGVAIGGIKKALQTLNPVVALAAGASLLALSAFAKARLSDLATPMAKGGIVLPTPGGTIAQIGEAGKAEAVIPLDRLGQMMGSGRGGGMMKPVVRISGRELLFMIEEEQQRQGRSF